MLVKFDFKWLEGYGLKGNVFSLIMVMNFVGI